MEKKDRNLCDTLDFSSKIGSEGDRLLRCDGRRCCFFCDDDDLVFVGRGASKEIVLTAFCEFKSFTEFSNGGWKIAHGQIGFFKAVMLRKAFF